MSELEDLIEISKYAGERFDLVQAGGGNSSVKSDDGNMYIKASGVSLSEVEKESGYAIIKNTELVKIFENLQAFSKKSKREADKMAADYVENKNLTPQFRASIETLLHAMLKKYTLHTHPIVVNAVTNRKNWQEVLRQLFGEDIVLVEYKTPGLSLALELRNMIGGKDAEIIFLQNHGLIVTSQYKEKIRELTEYVLHKIENYLDADMQRYKYTNEVSHYINGEDYQYVSYLSEDRYLNNLLKSDYVNSLPFCPDKMVYCGARALQLGENPDVEIREYQKQYHNIPKVVIYKGCLFFVAKNIKKAKEAEDVFKFHLFSLNLNKNPDICYLDCEEIAYLDNWEAEKYRREL